MSAALLATEATVVGALVAIALLLVTWISGPITVRKSMLVGFLVGAVFHLAFEFTGLNARYCTTGHACIS
jgi:hypothetical protein